jgi:hypothetical protein
MSEVSFYGLRGNPIVITMSLMSTWIMILVAVLDSDRFFGLVSASFLLAGRFQTLPWNGHCSAA